MKKKIFAFFACAMVLTAGVAMTACGKSGAGESTEVANEAKVSYSVSVETRGGMVMSDVEVYVYADDTLADLKHYATTDENGQTSFELAESETYAVTLSGVPKGYDVAASYAFSGNKATIVLTSSLIKDDDIATATLGVGDVMYDFTVTNSDGEKVVLSEVLADKELVLLNFWYTTCSWCMQEFPVMADVYQQYSEDVAIIALDPLDGEDAVKSFAAGVDYGFDFAKNKSLWDRVRTSDDYAQHRREIKEIYDEAFDEAPRPHSVEEIIENNDHGLWHKQFQQLKSSALLSLIYPDNEEYYNNLLRIVWA